MTRGRGIPQSAEQRLARVERIAGVGTWEWLPAEQRLTWSDAVYRLFGFERGEALDFERIVARIHPDDRARNQRFVDALLAGEDRGALTFRVVDPEGAVRHVQQHAEVLERDDDGRPTTIGGTMQDVSALRRAKQRLAEAQQTARIGSWEYDVTADRTIWSAEMFRIFGLDPASPEPPGWEEHRALFHPDDWPGLDLAVRRAAEHGEPYRIEFRILPPGGGLRWGWTICRVHRGPGGQVVRLSGTVQEITGRKRAEEALRRIDLRLKLAVDAGNVGLWDRDLSSGAVYLSPEWKRQLGYEDHELEGAYETWAELLHPDDRAVAEAAVQRSLSAPFPPYEVEFRLRHKDGSYRWIRATGRVTVDAAGARPLRITGCHVDLTAQRRVLRRLARSEALLTAAGRMARVGGWEVDVETRALSWTEITREIHEVGPDYDPSFEPALLFWHPEDRPRLIAAIERACSEGEPYDLTLRFVSAKGRPLWAHTKCQVIVEDGRPQRLLGTIQDVTEAHEHAARIEVERARAQGYLDVADVMLVALTPDGRVSMINRKGCEILGYAEHEIVGEDWFARFVPPELRGEVRSVFGAIVAGELPMHGPFENPVLNRGGEQRLIAWRNAPIVDDAGEITGTLSSGEDVTDQRKLQAQLAQADRLSSMGMLAAGVAHELNNPLTYVLYNLESLAEDFGRLAPGARLDAATLGELRDRFEDALDGTRRIHETTRGLGAFSRVETDERAPVQVAEVLEAACNLAANEIRHRAVLIKDHAPSDPVLASEGRLCQVFLNLLINAVHAIDEGDAERAEIVVSSWQEGGEVVAEVRDSGRGIAAADMPRLFEPFFTTKPIGEGSGLGLSISRDIVEGYGGRIEVESAPGQGARFRVRLPLPAATRAEVRVGARAEAPGEQGATRRARVLVVDDERAIRAVIVAVLRGHETVEAAGGAEARRLLERDRDFDLVLCDVMMPDVSGVDLHRWLVPVDPGLAERVVFITGGAFTPRTRDYLAEVGNRRLEKPFSPQELKELARDLTEASRAARPR